MKNLATTFFYLFCICNTLQAQKNNSNPSNRNSWKPRQVVQYIINGAKTGSYEGFETIADPLGESDGDTKSITSIATKDKKMQDAFKMIWGNVIIIGEGKSVSPNYWELPIEIYLPNKIIEEKIKLVRRENGTWYIQSF